MSRYIDADQLLEELCCDFTGQPFHGNRKVTIGNVRSQIEYLSILSAPKIETPIRGHWIEQEKPYVNTFECSNCRHWFVFEEETPTKNNYNYCPECGAKMEVE